MAAPAGKSFAHLHVHTEYSMLDGAARLDDMFRQCQADGMTAIAMTDHGNMYGAYDFWNKATKAGVKPIIGIEAYVAPEHRSLKKPVKWGTPAQKDDDISGAGAYTHMTLWAETNEGMHNLFRLASRASLEGFFRKPRMDRELLAEHAKGIIATTGCPGGEVPTKIRLGQEKEARQAAADFRDIFGKDNFFVEIMDHGLSVESRYRRELRQLAKELNLPFVVTNDSHYTYPDDAQAHGVLLCVQTGTNMEDPNRFKFEGNGYYVKSPSEMRAVSTGRGMAGRLRLHPADRRAGPDLVREAEPDAAVPAAGRRDRGKLAAQGDRGGDGPALPGRVRRAAGPPGRVRDRDHRADGVLLLLPGRGRLHHVGQAQRHPGRPGPRLGGRLHRGLRAGHHRPGPDHPRAGVRAVPQPRARVHARHRH